MSEESDGEQPFVPYVYLLSQGREPGVVLSARDLDRLAGLASKCRPHGWADLWLALAGAGAALALGALVAALTAPAALAGVLWALTGAGAAVLALSLFGYLTQRRDHGRELGELEEELLRLRRPAPMT